jgi:hypothetical protein
VVAVRRTNFPSRGPVWDASLFFACVSGPGKAIRLWIASSDSEYKNLRG